MLSEEFNKEIAPLGFGEIKTPPLPEVELPYIDMFGPAYTLECPVCGEEYDTKLEEKDHAMQHVPMSYYAKNRDDFDLFNEQIEDDSDPVEFMPEILEDMDDFNEVVLVVKDKKQERQLLDMPHTDCDSDYCPQHGKGDA